MRFHAKAYHFMQNQDLCGRVRLERGIRQGSPLSGLLFVVALTWGLAPMLREWDLRDLGLRLGNTHLGLLLYADDMLILA